MDPGVACRDYALGDVDAHQDDPDTEDVGEVSKWDIGEQANKSGYREPEAHAFWAEADDGSQVDNRNCQE